MANIKTKYIYIYVLSKIIYLFNQIEHSFVTPKQLMQLIWLKLVIQTWHIVTNIILYNVAIIIIINSSEIQLLKQGWKCTIEFESTRLINVIT